ncbi:Amino acid permease 3 [Olea europaea subsp. europaea]|uniref:Amino acid permease 3 n=1 Tax=Olea europaea subsp. europaea TaxID=158383 RepID=A0A8S0UNK5_OLEEU|nr:Amino acid permease 3 [Olea europaea subsp. europaea]
MDAVKTNRGTVWTASAHIITAVIGFGVLSLPWATAQLGWVAGPSLMILFTVLTCYTSTLLASCYPSGDPNGGPRNYSYMDAIKENLGGFQVKICGAIQYLNLFGVAIGYTIASSISMMAIKKSNCFRSQGDDSSCRISANPYMIGFGCSQIIFSQLILDFHQIWGLSIVATIMSFIYSIIGLSLGIAKIAENGKVKGSLTGISIDVVTPMEKIWKSLQALGDIAFAYSFSLILIDIQNTIKSPPSKYETMKKATLLSLGVTTIFYMVCGLLSYAAFGDLSPRNLLTGFSLYNPYWVLDIANAAIVIHLVGAYQVNCQPIFAFVEKTALDRFPHSQFIKTEIPVPIPGYGPFKRTPFQLVWRTIFVIITTILSILMPFFNDHIIRILGALGFWPLTIYFPVKMYIVQKKIPKRTAKWLGLQILSVACLMFSIAAAAGSIAGIVYDLEVYKPIGNMA